MDLLFWRGDCILNDRSPDSNSSTTQNFEGAFSMDQGTIAAFYPENPEGSHKLHTEGYLLSPSKRKAVTGTNGIKSGEENESFAEAIT